MCTAIWAVSVPSAATVVGVAVDVLLNLARSAPEELVALAALVKDGGVVVNTVPTIETPADEERGVRAVGVFVRSDAEQLSRLVAMVDRGELRVDVADRVPLAELADIHAKAEAGKISGKVTASGAGVKGLKVTVQRKVKSAWKAVATITTKAGGKFSVAVSKAGTYRAQTAAAPGYKGSTSGTVKVGS